MQIAPRYHVAFEIPEHLCVCAFVGAGREEGGVAREEGLGEEEDCDYEGERSANCAQVIVPLPTVCLA